MINQVKSFYTLERMEPFIETEESNFLDEFGEQLDKIRESLNKTKKPKTTSALLHHFKLLFCDIENTIQNQKELLKPLEEMLECVRDQIKIEELVQLRREKEQLKKNLVKLNRNNKRPALDYPTSKKKTRFQKNPSTELK